jgi:hypothetical protein
MIKRESIVDSYFRKDIKKELPLDEQINLKIELLYETQAHVEKRKIQSPDIYNANSNSDYLNSNKYQILNSMEKARLNEKQNKPSNNLKNQKQNKSNDLERASTPNSSLSKYKDNRKKRSESSHQLSKMRAKSNNSSNRDKRVGHLNSEHSPHSHAHSSSTERSESNDADLDDNNQSNSHLKEKKLLTSAELFNKRFSTTQPHFAYFRSRLKLQESELTKSQSDFSKQANAANSNDRKSYNNLSPNNNSSHYISISTNNINNNSNNSANYPNFNIKNPNHGHSNSNKSNNSSASNNSINAQKLPSFTQMINRPRRLTFSEIRSLNVSEKFVGEAHDMLFYPPNLAFAPRLHKENG